MGEILLSDKVKECRRMLEYKQEDIAKLLKTNQTMVCLMEKGYIPKKELRANVDELYKTLTKISKNI